MRTALGKSFLSLAGLNTAALPTDPAPLQPPATPTTKQVQEIHEVLQRVNAHDTSTVEEIAPVVSDLRCLAADWNNPSGYGYILRYTASSFKPLNTLKERLSAERSFYLSLYRARPDDNIHIYPSARVTFTGNWMLPAIVFSSGGIIYGCAGLESYGPTFTMNFIQSMGKIRTSDQRKALGNTWYEIFMERTIEAFANLHAVGVKLLLKVDKQDCKKLMLPRMVRDRYFNRKPEWNNYHALNFNRQRVRTIVKKSYT